MSHLCLTNMLLCPTRNRLFCIIYNALIVGPISFMSLFVLVEIKGSCAKPCDKQSKKEDLVKQIQIFHLTFLQSLKRDRSFHCIYV